MKRTGLLALVLIALTTACSGDDDDEGEAGSGGSSDDDAEVGEERSGGAGGSGGQAADGGGQNDAAAGSSGQGGTAAGSGGSSSRDDDSGADDGSSCTPIGEIDHPHDSQAPMHIAEPLPPSEYNSRPPSHGPHCGTWGHYAAYRAARPLPACNFLHNLEHGAIVLLYNCPEGCSEITEVLEEILASPPDDPDCIGPRLVLTPYEEMDTKVAAAAWGYTWTSDCMDGAARDSLVAFIEAHIGTRGDAPEPTVCGNGSFAP